MDEGHSGMPLPGKSERNGVTAVTKILAARGPDHE